MSAGSENTIPCAATIAKTTRRMFQLAARSAAAVNLEIFVDRSGISAGVGTTASFGDRSINCWYD